MSCVKNAHEHESDKVAQLLETIRAERPEYWPYGLSRDMFDPGDLFLISKSASEPPVGFVGWQERDVRGQRVGFYAVGVLPPYRNQGIAKEAIQQLLKQKAAGVDRMAALIAPGNVPSENLASQLGIPVVRKAASVKDFLRATWNNRFAVPAAGGLGNAAFFDYVMAPGRHEGELPFTGDWNGKRVGNTLLNFAIGAGAAQASKKGINTFRDPVLSANPDAISKAKFLLSGAGGSIMATPLKDNYIYAPGAIEGLKDLPHALAEAAKTLADKLPQIPKSETPNLMWPGLAVAAGLGGAGWLVNRAIKEKAEAPVNITTTQGGRLKVTLPTRSKGDAETVLDLPFDQQRAITRALQNRLELDARRRLYEESKARIRKRKDTQAMRALHPQTAFLPNQNPAAT